MPITVTTDLPGVSFGMIDSSTEDQLTPSWSDTQNYGQYRVQIKQSSEPSYSQETVVGQNTTQYIFTGLSDGEEYDIRLRGETEHKETSWVELTAITFLPTLSNLTASAGSTSVSLSWGDTVDNESGIRIFKRLNPSETSTETRAEISNEPANTISYTDDNVSPSTTYEYVARVYTEHVFSDTSVTTETQEIQGATARPQKPDGWYASIEAPDGSELEPTIIGEPSYQPGLNAKPRVEIPVPRNERWSKPAFDDAPLYVTYDGYHLPIEQLREARQEPQKTVLVGIGGVELETRVTPAYDSALVHEAARNLVQNNTGYATNIDDPASGSQNNVLMQQAQTQSELENELASPFADDVPLEITGNGIEMTKVAYVSEGEDSENGIGRGIEESSQYSGQGPSGNTGVAETIGTSSSDFMEFTFTIEHTIPEEHVGVLWRDETPREETPGLSWQLDGYEIDTLSASNSIGRIALGWNENAQTPFDAGDGWSFGDLSAGQHTMRVDVTSPVGSINSYAVDVVALVDLRYVSNDPDDTVFDASSGGNYLEYPEPYPSSVSVTMQEVNTPFNVTSIGAEAVFDNVSGAQSLTLSNDGGITTKTANNTASVTQTFDNPGSTIEFKFTLSNYGSREQTPGLGYLTQTLESFEITADLEDVPTLINQGYDNELDAVINNFSEQGNFIWELTREDGEITFQMTTYGQRQSDVDIPVEAYDVTRSTDGVYRKAVVYGSSGFNSSEQFSASHGSSVVLDRERIVEGSEAVYSDGTQFVRGSDYNIDYQSGEITTLSSGGMSDGSVYNIDYRYRTFGEYTSPVADDDPRTLTLEIPDLVTDATCEQIAVRIVDLLDTPSTNAEIVVPEIKPDQSLVESLVVEGIPTDEDLEIWDVTYTDLGIKATLGSRRSASKIISDIKTQLTSVSRQV